MSDIENQTASSAEMESKVVPSTLRQAPVDSSIQATIRRKVGTELLNNRRGSRG